MKKLFFAASASICCFLIACNNNNGSSGNDKNIAAARDIYKGIETGDSTKLASIAPDAIDHAGPNGDVKNGDSIKAYLMDMHNHAKDLKFDFLGEAANGDYVYEWTKMTGTALDSSMGFAKNQPFSITGVDILKFRDGKAVEHWGTIDQHDVMMMRAQQMPGATTVVVTKDSTKDKDTSTKK